MFRSIQAVIESTDISALYTRPLGPMFATGIQQAQLQLSAPIQVDHLWTLQQLINNTVSSPEELDTYNLTINQLQEAFNLLYNQNAPLIKTADIFR